jgi:serine/threonine protein phosphatase PrpC
MSQALSDLQCRVFALPKKGNSRKEYEDASRINCEPGRFAVADGVSESVFSGEWASLLCESFVAGRVAPANFEEWRSEQQQHWLALVKRGNLPWYLEEKLREGAFATFLGLSFAAASAALERPWHALAVGDSCLFHVRKGLLKRAFPVNRAGDFGTRPRLIGSRQLTNAVPATIAGTLRQGDVLLLMTDALAEWFLREHEAGHAPWSELVCLRANDFALWVDALRLARELKNDDVTLLIVELDALKK